MKSVWFKDCKTPEEKEARRKELRSYHAAFEALDEVLAGLTEELGTPDYDLASWSHKQADVNGANRKLRTIRNLINIKE